MESFQNKSLTWLGDVLKDVASARTQCREVWVCSGISSKLYLGIEPRHRIENTRHKSNLNEETTHSSIAHPHEGTKNRQCCVLNAFASGWWKVYLHSFNLHTLIIFTIKSTELHIITYIYACTYSSYSTSWRRGKDTLCVRKSLNHVKQLWE